MKKNRNPKILKLPIILPIGTLVIVGWLFILSSFYEPSWIFDWAGIRPEIRDTVKLVDKYGSITSGSVGIEARTPQEWYTRIWLMKNADEDELKTLLAYPKGAVKATAYEGLIKKPNATSKFDLIYQALNDTTTFIHYQSGCVGEPLLVGEYLIDHVTGISGRLRPFSPESVMKYNLSDEEINTLMELYHKRMNKKDEYLKKNYQ
ncbi:MAG TPA: hypothetical protein PKC40_06990 [Saprospiraceae bacterium]|nr:hypothetical protein [Saprospiraceae bacterium]